jgi:hypothetical protein
MKRVDLQMMQRPIMLLLLLVQLLVAAFSAQPVQAAGIGSLSGRVFVDANGNGLPEPGEAAVAAATVYLQLQGTAAPATEVLTDAQGVFILRDLDLGTYEVWAASQGKTAKNHTVIEIGEVSAPVLLELPVYENTVFNKTVAEGLLFLPLLKP